jgi:hypothetical protein
VHIRVIRPVAGDVSAASLIKVAKVVIADRRKRNSLNERTSKKHIKEIPEGLAGVQQIARVGFAATEAGSRLYTIPSLPILLTESKESDVGQLKGGQVGDHIVCELDLLVLKQKLRSLDLNIFSSWGDVVTVGLYN